MGLVLTAVIFTTCRRRWQAEYQRAGAFAPAGAGGADVGAASVAGVVA
jgi:hypothetical protein